MLARLSLLMVTLLAVHVQAGELLIETQMVADGGLVVTYTPPPGIYELSRTRDGASANDFWKKHVRPLDSCSQVQDRRLVLRKDPDCKSIKVGVTPVLLDLNADYEAALPMKDQGVLSYTNYFLTAAEGHGLRWRWTAPAGGQVLHQGRLHTSSVEQVLSEKDVNQALLELHKQQAWERLGGEQYVFLGRARFAEIPGGVLVYDKLLDESRIAVITQMLNAAMQGLGTAYRRWPAGPVGVVVTTSNSPGFRGDVTQGRMMSLRLPRSGSEQQATRHIQRFIAHEVTHWWNMGVFSSDNSRPWLHEGHAEWTALLLMRSLNLWSRDAAVAHLEASIAKCIALRGSKSAASLNTGYGREDDPYACGLALMFAAQLMRDLALPPSEAPDPLSRLATLHSYDKSLTVADFSSWADASSSGPMATLLLDKNQPFEAGFVQLLVKPGLARVDETGDLAAFPPHVATAVATTIVNALMNADCNGSVGHWRLDDAFRLDGRLNCKSLRLGQDLLAINGVSLTKETAKAWQGFVAACNNSPTSILPTLTVQYRSGPPSVIACPAELPPLPFKSVISLNKSVLEKYGY